MVSKMRAQRISDRIFEEISTILLMDISDPRLGSVTVTDVSVDREMAFAKIFVSSIEGSDSAPSILDGLNHAKGFLRRKLAQRIPLRYFPKLRFYWDTSPERGDRIDRLLNELPDLNLTSHSGEEDPPLNG